MLRIKNGSIKHFLHIAIVALVMFGLVPLAVAADRYVATTGNNTSNNCLVSSTPCLTIGYAITQAAAGDTINVAAGTYTQDLVIPISKANLELKPASGANVTIKGVANVAAGLWPTAAPNIEILGSGTKIHGFTIEGPAPATNYYSSGMVIGATDVEIYDNAFKVPNAGNTNDISQGIQTYHKLAVPGVDVSGLNVHNNTFTNLGTGTVGFEAIYINRDADTASGAATIADNQFTGYVFRGVTTERSNTTISDNSIVTDVVLAVAWQGILVRDSATQDSVMITGNTVKGSSASVNGFAQGILIGASGGGQTLTNISVMGNTVQGNTVGVRVRSSANGVIVNSNDISGNITYGVENTDTANTLDAQYNWWGDASGPLDIVGTTEVPPCTGDLNADGTGDSVSDYVDYCPWLGGNADLVVTSVLTDSTAEAGASIDVKDTTKNKGTTWVGPTTTRIYFSSDTILDSSDTVLGSRAVPALAGGASSLAETTVTLPSGISGKFYIIAEADADDDYAETNETNNAKATGKPTKIGSELYVKAFTAPKTANDGTSIDVQDTTRNKGPAAADVSVTVFYLSTNFTLDAGDTEIGSRAVPALAALESSAATTSLTLPSGIAGIYYIIVMADADDDLGEVDENNNTRFRKIKITGAPDLGISSLAATGSAGAGDSIDVDDTTANTGTVNAGASTTRFYLSTDSTFNPGDIPLGSRSVPVLAASASDSATTSVDIPADTLSGSYYIIARADSNGQVAEDSETNNTASTAITILP